MRKSLIRNLGAWTIFLYDILSALISWFFVHILVMGEFSVSDFTQPIFIIIAFSISTKLFRSYASLWKTVSADDLKRNIYAVVLGCAIFFALEFISNRLINIARSEVVFYPVLTLVITLAGRFFYRQYLLIIKKKHAKKIILIGGGNGASLFLRENDVSNNPYNVLAIFDDDKKLHGKLLRNNIIVDSISSLEKATILDKYPADEILIAIPSLRKIKLQKIYRMVTQLGLPIKVMPSLMDLTQGARLTDLQEVKIEDLLGRDQVRIRTDKFKTTYDEKNILVTGGAGSIGSEICRQLLHRSRPKHLMIFDHNEYNLYMIERELENLNYDINISFILGDIADIHALDSLFDEHEINIVFHVAAYKHVPLLEEQPKIAIQNNIFGTKNVVDLCSKYQIERFLLVSTDKAVNPTNIMGATKRIAELYVNSQKNTKTKFMVTRFGNVLGSSGSVVPLFKKQLKEGGPISVTHKNIARYFMTISEASLLVVLSCAIGKGNETFVLEMGKAIKVITLAEQMIKLSGKEPYVDIDIQFTGLRPGEKMYEELFYSKENLKESGFEKLLIGTSSNVTENKMNNIIQDIFKNMTKAKLLEVVDSISNS